MNVAENVDINYKSIAVQFTAEDAYAWMRLAKQAEVILRLAARQQEGSVIHYAFDITGTDDELRRDLAASELQTKKFFARNPELGSYSEAYDGKVVFYADRLNMTYVPND